MMNLTKHATDDLLNVLNALKPALKSIDVRTVAVCPSSEEDWQNLVTSIIISDKTLDEIKAEHENLRRVRNSDNQFAIFMKAYAFNYLIFDEIPNGKIRFPTPFGTNRVKTRVFNPLNLKVTSTQERLEGSTYYVLKAVDHGDLEARKNFWDIIYRQNSFAKTLGFPNVQKLIQNYLKIEKYDHNARKDLEITILPLAKIGNIRFSKKQVNINLQNPHKLNNLQLNLHLENYQRNVWLNPRQINGKDNSVAFGINNLLPLDTLIVELIHRDSGLTLDRTSKKVPLENIAEPFVKIVDTFCSLKKIEKMLFKPEEYGKNPDKIFENAVTWLLSLAGYETVNVGIIITKLNNKQEKFDELHLKNSYHIGSADIIAYEENERLILIDCDINTVDPRKVEKLAELKKHFRDKLKGYEKLRIVPILFTPRDFRKTSPSTDVMIADQTVIKRMFEFVVKGDREQARSLLYYSGL
jgi:hypothetical protein